MKVGKKLFPYPTLNNAELINAYVDSHYSIQFEMEINDKYLLLKNTHIDIKNISIERLIEENKAKAVLIIECSQTLYRKTFELSIDSQNIEILLSDLNGSVEISSFIYALEDISSYSSEYFIDDYREYSFDIDKYDILAIDDGYRIKIMHEDKKDKKISSIFSVIPNSNSEVEEGVEVSADKDKIVIIIPQQYYGLYDNMRFNDNFTNIFFGLLGISALETCLQTIRDNFEEYNDDLEEVIFKYTWFTSVMKRYENLHNKPLTADAFKEIDSFWLAQELLDFGTSKAIGDLNKLLWEDNKDDLY